MILSGTSTTISSNKEPIPTDIPPACVAANTASPHTLPVVPPQNIIFSGVDTSTAASQPPSAQTKDLGNVDINPILARIPTASPIHKLVNA